MNRKEKGGQAEKEAESKTWTERDGPTEKETNRD